MSADEMSNRKAVYPVGRNEVKVISDGDVCETLIEEQETLKQEMRLQHMHD